MTGFPDRPPRVAFGPQMENVRPPRIPNKDLSANQMNLTFWQTAGAGRVLPLVVILFDGTTPAIIFQGLAFDPRQELGSIAFVKNGTGDYTFAFASTYKDESGTDTPFTPRASIAMVQGGAAGDKATAFVPSGQDIQFNLRDSSDVLKDGTFMLAVW